MAMQPPATGTRLEDRLARGLLAWRDRYVAWVRRHPRLVDAALVAVILVLSGPHAAAVHGRSLVWLLVLIPALLLPLIWRRRAPFVVFLVISAAALVQAVAHQALFDDVALLVAFYTVVAYEPGRRILAAAAILEAGSALAALRFGVAVHHLISVWVFISALVTAAGLIGYYVRTRRAYLASLVGRAERLERERDREALLAAAAERARIAREMHDIVAHNLAVMIALADGAAYTARADPGRAVAIMGQVSGTGRSALTEMRRLLGVMRPPGASGPEHAPQPTLADLDDLLETVRAAGLPTSVIVSGQPAALPPSVQLVLYRMIQEALTNTLKHAAATSARVRIAYRPGKVELEVTDNGQPDAVPASEVVAAGAGSPAARGAPGSTIRGAAGGAAGHGIAGMRERAAFFGGKVLAGPRAGGGWRVHTVLSLDPAPPGASAAATAGAARPSPTR